MKSSTKKILKSVSKKDYVLAGNDYTKVDPHYIVLYTNVKKVVRVNAVNEETAIERALAREIDKNTKNLKANVYSLYRYPDLRRSYQTR